MKKLLSIVLSVVMLVSCMSIGLTMMSGTAAAGDGSLTVSATVMAQDGKLGGVLTCESTQYANAGDFVTVSAKPYYGNGFLGWYDTSDQLKSTELNYRFEVTENITLKAKFDIRNLFENGDFEAVSTHSSVVTALTSGLRYGNAGAHGSYAVVSNSSLVNTDDTYGDYALKLTPAQNTTDAGKKKGLVNIAIPVEKNTDYIIRFSYKYDDNITRFSYWPNGGAWSSEAHCIYWSINGTGSNGKIPWDNASSTVKATFSSQNTSNATLETDTWNWGGGRSDNFTSDNGKSTAKYWQEMYILFNPQEDAQIFKDGADTGTAYLNLGTNNGTLDFMYIDNMVIAEASYNDRTVVETADGNTVVNNSHRANDNYYVYTSYARGNASVYTGRDTSKVYYPSIYENYTATSSSGAEFEGWYNEAGDLVSTSTTALLEATGEKYNAKFEVAPVAGDGGMIKRDGDNYTAYAYYGNKFLGWYDGDTLVSSNLTESKSVVGGKTAKFTTNNMITDGSFEVGGDTTAQIYNDYFDYGTNVPGSKQVIQTCVPGSGPEFGNYCLSLVPSQDTTSNDANAKPKSLLSIPIQVEEGKTYVWRFSYTFTTGVYDKEKDYLHLSVNKPEANGNIAWGHTVPYSFHAQPHSTEGWLANDWSWGQPSLTAQGGVYGHVSTKNFSGTNEWIDVTVTFPAAYTGLYYLTLGTLKAATNTIVIDNMFCAEAEQTVEGTDYPLSQVVSGGNGEVISHRAGEPAYYTELRAGDAGTYNEVMKTQPFYAPIYEEYFVKPAIGYIFDGWYDENDQLISNEDSIAVYSKNEKVTAKFIPDPNRYTATAEIEKNGNVFGGYIDGDAEITEIISGSTVSFTAVAYNGSRFDGWYKNGDKVTADPTVSYVVTKDVEFVAKFVNANLFTDSGLENGTAGTDLAGTEWIMTGENSATVVAVDAFSGRNSVNFYSPDAALKSKTFAVEADVVYNLSFAWKAGSSAAKITSLKLVDAATGTPLHTDTDFATANDAWQKYSANISVGDATSVYVEITYGGATTSLYLDDLALFNTADASFKITSTLYDINGIYPGYIATDAVQYAGYDQDVTVKAVCYERNEFLGWYDGDTLKSTDAEYTFKATEFADLVAKFVLKNIYPDSGAEHTQLGTTLSQFANEDTFGNRWELKVDDNNEIIHDFDVVAAPHEKAYDGNNVYKFTHRNNNMSTRLEGLKPNTNYAFSFYWMIQHVNPNCYFSTIKINGTKDTELVLATGSGTSAVDGEWQKIVIPFNTQQETAITITMSYHADSGDCYVDNFALYESSYISVNGGDGGTVEFDAKTVYESIYSDIVFDTSKSNNITVNSGYIDTTELLTGKINNFGFETKTVDKAITSTTNFKYVIEKEKISVYNNGNLIALKAPESSNTQFTAFEGALIGFDNYNDTSFTIDNISLKKLDGSVWSDNLVSSDQRSIEINDNCQQMLDGITLDGNSTYEFEFDVVFSKTEEEDSDNAPSLGTVIPDTAFSVILSESSKTAAGAAGPYENGTIIKATATPEGDNEFLGWYDYRDISICYSKNTGYEFTVEDAKYIIAYFKGEGVEPINYFVDGDFEHGSFGGVLFTHPNYTVDWCTYSTITANNTGVGIQPISGEKALRVSAQSRYSNMFVNNLKPRTDYTLSFWWNADEYVFPGMFSILSMQEEDTSRLDQTTHQHPISHVLNFGTNECAFADESLGYAYISNINYGDWRYVEIPFTNDNRTSIALHFDMARNAGSGFLYFDDIRVTEGHTYSEDDVANGSFDSDGGWQGEYEIADGVLKSSDIVSSNVILDMTKPYTLTFDARSADGATLAFGVNRGGNYTPVSNSAYNTVDLASDWKTYTVDFYTKEEFYYTAMFSSMNGGQYELDNVKIAPASNLIVFEKLDFEDESGYQISTGSVEFGIIENNKDYYSLVSEGENTVLKMEANKADGYVPHRLAQEWSKFKMRSGTTYTISLKARSDAAGQKFNIQTSYTSLDWKYSQMLDKNQEVTTDWKTYEFTFTAANLLNSPSNVWFTLDGVRDATNAPIYFDDICIRESANSIYDDAPSKLYTQDISKNYFQNYSFEKDGDVFSPYVKSGNADFGNRFVTFKAGDKLVVPVSTRVDYNVSEYAAKYTFASSIRGDASAKGYVALAYGSDGSNLLADTNGKEVSKLSVNTAGEWKRSGFSFHGNRWTNLYLVIECTAGTFDVDYLALFNATHSYDENQLDTSKTEFVGFTDMTSQNKGNYINGNITGLPTDSYVILKGEKTYIAAVDNTTGYYEFIRMPVGTYTMFVAPGGLPYLTMWGDLTFEGDGIVSGLACERLSGNAILVSGEGVRNGIVKIVDEDTGWAYLTATSDEGLYDAYILDCVWYIEGTTNDKSALDAYGLEIENFNAKTMLSAGIPATSERSLIAVSIALAVTSIAAIAFSKKKGACI